MTKLLIVLALLVSFNANAGVKGSISYEMQSIQTHTQIPYTVCAPTCQTVTNDYYSNSKNNSLRLNLGYEQQISGPVSTDFIFGTTLMDYRLEANLKYNINDNLSIKTGVNGYKERSNSTFKYSLGLGQQVGIEYKLPSQGELNPFVDVKYYRMNTSYGVSESNSVNDVKKNAVSIGIGLSF